ncbi:MAG: type IIA DNA topoisomerase subunit B [Flavobacteriales bacterium]|nr:type IIA DNA topoisomerase subunit B [Flavobacteriales bacterium]MBK6944894.1 type IIA DNA topoisomerase subunit B [Flavobacteriales bacterium]MBK7239244.1 type IIA DNA topoisomerase subunit B [Flavobacteriales bacterium]MBK7297473.1 type IIA DNA topoisomerase subunit B [Flavobacteriales bacterium]MBK9535552.1 type IIA DNA topoisomerase subunit B [Flavobacteriales bacterium]
MSEAIYNEDNIRSLDWKEHIRLRPGMYIGKLGDGSSFDDGVYILIKEVLDNCIDEFVMGHGKKVDVIIEGTRVEVRDYGRGVPLGKVVDVVSKINTGAKYDSKAFKKSVGLNGVGTKAVNALSGYFKIESVRDGQMKRAEFDRGVLRKDEKLVKTDESNGTRVVFEPDAEMFKSYQFRTQHIERLLWNYCYLNTGLAIYFNGQKYQSKNGLLDLLEVKMDGDPLYPIIHLKGNDIEVAITHANHYGEEYYSFVNGQHTTQGGTHQGAFREAVAKTIKDYFKKDWEAGDVRTGIVAAISVKVMEPVFESQTKTKLGSLEVEPGGQSMRSFIGDFMGRELNNFLHKNTEVADVLQQRILNNERERKELSGIRKLARDRAKKASLHNRKLRDCRIHLNDPKKDDRKEGSTLFITEGDSASGSITKSRDVNLQAVFSLKGKPLNCYGLTKKVVYENEEFNLIQAALNIEDGMDGLRYNRIVIATDADVDGMHIRLLLMTFFLQFFPDLVKNDHLYILQTPLFRVRNKKETIYCYSDEERQRALIKLGKTAEITRFKGLGEISPDEFKNFIGEDIRLEPVMITKDAVVQELLGFYMGKNTPTRQEFIIANLVVEKDLVEEIAEDPVKTIARKLEANEVEMDV